MNRDRLSWGMLLLFIGVMWLLSNLGVIHFYWGSIWRLWPLYLILLGINIMIPRNSTGNIISFIATMLALIIIGYQGTKPSNGLWWDNITGGSQYDEHRDSRDSEGEEQIYTAEYSPEITEASLTIKGGAVEYIIEEDPTDNLFVAQTKGSLSKYSLASVVNDGKAQLDFNMKGKKSSDWNFGDSENQAVHMKLNTNPLWNINLEMGAGTANFDLKKYKLASLRFKGGAASVEAELGMPVNTCQIEVNAGAASIAISIPKQAMCKIDVNSGLSSKDFSGFKQLEKGVYVTENYDDNSDVKYLLQLKGGLTSFEVKQY